MTCSPITPAAPSLAEPAGCCLPLFDLLARGSGYKALGGTLGTWSFDAAMNLTSALAISGGWLIWSDIAFRTYFVNTNGVITDLGASPWPLGTWNPGAPGAQPYIQVAPNGTFIHPGDYNDINPFPANARVVYSTVGDASTPFNWTASAPLPGIVGYGFLGSYNSQVLNIGSHILCYGLDAGFPPINQLIHCVRSVDAVNWTDYAQINRYPPPAYPTYPYPYVQGAEGMYAGYGKSGLALIVARTRRAVASGHGVGTIWLTAAGESHNFINDPLQTAVQVYVGTPPDSWYDVQPFAVTYISSTNTWVVVLYFKATFLAASTELWCMSSNDGVSWSVVEKSLGPTESTLLGSVISAQDGEVMFRNYFIGGGSHGIRRYLNPTDLGTVVLYPSSAIAVIPLAQGPTKRP